MLKIIPRKNPMNDLAAKEEPADPKYMVMSHHHLIPPDPYDLLPVVTPFTLESDDVEDGIALNPRFAQSTRGAQDVSPELRWSGFPQETCGFVVTCFDPDAATGSGFWHWMLVGLPPTVTMLWRGAGVDRGLPEGAFHVRNDFGVRSYGGPAPPKGDRPHRYVFAVHALDVSNLDVTKDTTPARAGFDLTLHTIARAVIRPTYAL
jgi:Raf kinase inhibitor-like YbhB/YbcL family protein